MATFEVDNPANPTGMMIMMLQVGSLDCFSLPLQEVDEGVDVCGKSRDYSLDQTTIFANKEFLADRVRSRRTVNINLVVNATESQPSIAIVLQRHCLVHAANTMPNKQENDQLVNLTAVIFKAV